MSTSSPPSSGTAKRLLDAMAKDQPAAEGRRRAALALGLTPLAPPGPQPATPSPAQPAAPAPAASVASAWSGHVALWAAGTVATSALVGAIFLRGHSEAPIEQPSAAIAHSAAIDLPAAPRATAPSITAPTTPSITTPTEAPPAHADSTTPKRPRRHSPTVAAAAPMADLVAAPALEAAATPRGEPQLSSLSIETTLLDGARTALRRNAGRSALELLDRYDHEVTGGELAAEAEALRIEATLAIGDRATATRLADRFFGGRHDRALTSRVRSLFQITGDQSEPFVH